MTDSLKFIICWRNHGQQLAVMSEVAWDKNIITDFQWTTAFFYKMWIENSNF